MHSLPINPPSATLLTKLAAGLTLACLLIVGCGGGGGGDSLEGAPNPKEIIFYGTLTEKGSGHSTDLAESALNLSAKHSSGERLEGVRVCIYDTCSVTDINGRWGLNLSDLNTDLVTITVKGHGIDSQVQLEVDPGAEDVNVDLAHNSNSITVESLVVDGVSVTG
jgi:hypothetical protein